MRSRVLVAVAFSAIFLAATFSCAQDLNSANLFLKSTFALYDNSGRGTPIDDRYFHSSLLLLIHADQAAAERLSEIPGPLDADLLCDCQDWDGIWDLKMKIAAAGPKRAVAVASFSIVAPPARTKSDWRKTRIILVPEHGGWRIYDIVYLSEEQPGQPNSLRKQLQQDILSLAKKPDTRPRD